MKPLCIIVATDARRGIGAEGTLPWRLPGEMRHFMETTLGSPPRGQQNAVIMGRRTWESLPPRFQPLPGRVNCVVSRRRELELEEGVLHAASVREAYERLAGRAEVADIFAIGGAGVYAEALGLEACTRIVQTQIQATFPCDTFFPKLDATWRIAGRGPEIEERGLRYQVVDWERHG